MKEPEPDRNYQYDNENCIEFLRDSKVATVTFSQGRYIAQVERLAREHPDAVQIVHRNKSSIVAHVPVSYIKVRPPKAVSEEQRQKAAERLSKFRPKPNVIKDETAKI